MHAQHIFHREERPHHTKHELYLKRLRVGVEAYVKTLAIKAAAKATAMASVAADLMDSGAVITSVDMEADLDFIPWWQQGDAALSTAENMRKRMRCRHSDEVTEALGAFWSIAQAPSSEESGGSRVVQQSYFELYLRIYKVCAQTLTRTWRRMQPPLASSHSFALSHSFAARC